MNEKIALDSYPFKRYETSFLKNQMYANETYNRILGSFRKGTVIDYPEHYGGAYINERGFLTVLVSDDTESAKQDIINRAEDKSIVLLPCEHSYRKLQEITDTIYAYQINHPGDVVSNNINSYTVADQKNCIEVGLFNNTPDKVSEFKKNVCDSDTIIFKDAPESNEYSFKERLL